MGYGMKLNHSHGNLSDVKAIFVAVQRAKACQTLLRCKKIWVRMCSVLYINIYEDIKYSEVMFPIALKKTTKPCRCVDQSCNSKYKWQLI